MRDYDHYFHQKKGDVRKQRESIKKALSAGPSTVSALHKFTKFPKDLLVWNLVGMMRWGEVEVTGEDENELIYSIKEV